jgi:hypothetical protein
MDRHKKAGASDRQPAQEVQLHQQLNDTTLLKGALAYARSNPAHELVEKAREKGSTSSQGEIAHARTKAHVDGPLRPVEAAPVQAPARTPLRLYTLEEIKSRPSPQWLIDSLLPQGALCVLFGPSGCGKSFIALDWCLSIACARPWFNHAVAQGLVVYIAAEGGTGLKQRIIAWEAARSCTAANGWVIEQAVNLLDKNNSAALIDLISQALSAKPILIIFDTLARCLVGGDENSAKDVGQAIATLDEIRFQTGACVLVVHHSGKGNNSIERGSSALRGAADTMVKVEERGKNAIEINVDKQKDAEAAEPIGLELVAYGDSYALEVACANQSPWLTNNEITLVQALANAGEPLRNKALLERSGLPERTFNRVLGALKGKRVIMAKDGAYDLTDDAKRCHCQELPTSCHDSSSTVTAKLSHPFRGDSWQL